MSVAAAGAWECGECGARRHGCGRGERARVRPHPPAPGLAVGPRVAGETAAEHLPRPRRRTDLGQCE